MRRIFRKLGDIAFHRLVDPRLQFFDQRVAGAEQIVRRLGAAAQRLAEIFAGAGMQPVQRRIELGIEAGHVGKTFRRLQVETAHQRVIAVERLVAPVLQHARGDAEQRQARTFLRRQRQSLVAQPGRFPGSPRISAGSAAGDTDRQSRHAAPAARHRPRPPRRRFIMVRALATPMPAIGSPGSRASIHRLGNRICRPPRAYPPEALEGGPRYSFASPGRSNRSACRSNQSFAAPPKAAQKAAVNGDLAPTIQARRHGFDFVCFASGRLGALKLWRESEEGGHLAIKCGSSLVGLPRFDPASRRLTARIESAPKEGPHRKFSCYAPP